MHQTEAILYKEYEGRPECFVFLVYMNSGPIWGGGLSRYSLVVYSKDMRVWQLEESTREDKNEEKYFPATTCMQRLYGDAKRLICQSQTLDFLLPQPHSFLPPQFRNQRHLNHLKLLHTMPLKVVAVLDTCGRES